MLYTRQQSVPPSYSGSLFREQEQAADAEQAPQKDAGEMEESVSEAAEETENTETAPQKMQEQSAPVSAGVRRGSPSLLSRLGLGRLFGGIDLEDLLILAVAFILLIEDGESDLLPLLLALLLTGK